jgi:predicted transcriptional regulator
MPRNRKLGAWSYKEDRRLLELAKHSKQAEEIANLMNRSPGAIRKMAIRLGVSLNKAKGK